MSYAMDYSAIPVIDVARLLFGPESPTRSTKTEKHFPDNGALFVNTAKNKWFSHLNEKGGDAIELVRHAKGCDFKVALNWLREQGHDVGAAAHGANGAAKPRQIVAEYDYASADGTVLYQAVRYAPKDFRQRRSDGNGGWIWKGPETAVPYRLPELLASGDAPVLIPGGEKDVENLRALGFTATCNHGGEGKWWPELTQHFEGRRVFILCDNDLQGEKHQQVVGAALKNVVKELYVVRFPELPAGGDVSDFIDKGATKQDLARRFQTAAEWSPLESATVETETGQLLFATDTGLFTRPVILVEKGELHRLATKGEETLIKAKVDFYSRGGALVRPVIDEVDASHGRKTKSARLLEVSPDSMVDYLSRYISWQRKDKRQKTTEPADPPRQVAAVILSRDGEWKFRRIAGVITAPTMRPVASLRSSSGSNGARQGGVATASITRRAPMTTWLMQPWGHWSSSPQDRPSRAMSSPTPSRTGSSHSGLRRPRHEASGPQPRPQ